MARIVVIDDDLGVREALATFLQRLGHEVDVAKNGKEAMSYVDDARRVDLVLTDINMPEMDGVEVIMALRRETPPVPVVAISGGGIFSSEFLLANAKLMGAVATIMKPFQLEEVQDAVESALAQAE